MSPSFREARDLLLELRTEYSDARRRFSWPHPERFNWALDWFDVIARDNPKIALRLMQEREVAFEASFETLRQRSNQLANHLRAHGLQRGDRILLMLGNVPVLWETMLAAIKLGCPLVPTTTLMTRDDLADRLARGKVRAVVTESDCTARFADLLAGRLGFVAAAQAPEGWHSLAQADGADPAFDPQGETLASDPLLLYFTSGTTARPKLVCHTHVSYPVGHLTTMYWLGLRPGDVHFNLSSPGWAKHAWSCFFAPWSAEATIVAAMSGRFDATTLMHQIVNGEVTSFCAPPTVWRSLVQLRLDDYAVRLRELASAGEPLNAEIIGHVRRVWNITIRDGFGQTETSLLIGNFPGQPVVPGTVGRPAPGFEIELLDADGVPAQEGEICIALADSPVGVTTGYLDDDERTAHVMRDGYYHTGDVAMRGSDGLITYVGRNDDVFKSSDYRISPFELESVLIEHPMVQEAAVVPSPDLQRLSVPKAFVVLVAGHPADAATAQSILAHVRQHVSPYKRVRRIEFGELPKTVSGKIRRVELRVREQSRDLNERAPGEFWEEDFQH